MTTTVHAYAAKEINGPLQPFEYELGPLGPHDVDISVDHCGICHSDLSMLENAWDMTTYPFVPGHEVCGTVEAVGEHINHVQPGDRVGLGWHAGYCMTCPQCLSGHHNMCANSSATIVGRHGGFADKVRAQGASVIKLPHGIDPKTVGPLFCGGITVFNSLAHYAISPTAHVGVIGIGGLGHMALMFARAWGCHVTAFTSSDAKMSEALELGAHETINSRDAASIQAASRRFDLLLCTVNVTLDWNNYLSTLKPRGRLHLLGALMEPISVQHFALIMSQLSISASPVGSPATIATMLEFAVRHDLKPVTEHFRFDQVNDAMEHLRSGKARYRIVLSR